MTRAVPREADRSSIRSDLERIGSKENDRGLLVIYRALSLFRGLSRPREERELSSDIYVLF